MILTGSKDIKFHLKKLLLSMNSRINKESRILDIPCGNGVSLKVLKNMGFDVIGADLFPELNRNKDIPVIKADLGNNLPFEKEEFDMVLCQEGIEHTGNQNDVFMEISRILKTNGLLILTTPNYSNIKSKLSYLLTESEAFGRIMPTNEIDSIWLSTQQTDKVYFGHVFLTGFTRLRLFAKLAGFEILKIHETRINYTSLIFFPFIYPLILFFSLKTYLRFIRKTNNKKIGRELLKYMIMPKLLLQGHMMIEFCKKRNPCTTMDPSGPGNDFSMTT